ncbi:MAG: hypothetical protein ACK47B_08095 [Armatimonadota bacterium]
MSNRGRKSAARIAVAVGVLLLVCAFLFRGHAASALGGEPALTVYVLRSGSAEQDGAVEAALQEAGYSVTMGVPTPVWDGTSADLTAFDVVVLLNSYNWISTEMPSAGQRALMSYVAGGGGLITAEWLMWNVYRSGAASGLAPALPATTSSYVAAVEPITYTRAAADPVLDEGVADSFTFAPNDVFGSESTLKPKQGATVFYQSGGASGAGVLGWDYREGRVLSFSTFISQAELAHPDYRRLFRNGVRWAAGDSF